MRFYYLTLLLFFSLPGKAQIPFAYNFSGVQQNIKFLDVVEDGNCGHYVFGYNSTNLYLFILHLNEMGDTLWAKALNFTPYNPTNYGMIDKNEHGIFFLTGKHISTSQSSTNYYSILGKLDFNGDLIWSKINYSNFYNLSNLKVDGRFLYLALNGVSSDTLSLFKLDTDGNEIWKKGFLSQPSFSLPGVKSLQLDTNGNVTIIGNMSSWASMASMGNFLIKIDSLGNIINSYRIYGLINTELYNCEGAFDDSNRSIFISNLSNVISQSKSLVKLQKVNKITGQIVSKCFQPDDSLNVFSAKTLFVKPNKVIITGCIGEGSIAQNSFQLELDTNLDIVSSIQYKSVFDSLSILLFKTTNDCNVITSFGNLIYQNRESGYLIKKQNLNDTICNMGFLLFNDSLKSDSLVNLPITAYPTKSWTNVIGSTSEMFFLKNTCTDLTGFEQVKDTKGILSVFPNPTTDKTCITGIILPFNVIIYNILGEEVGYFVCDYNNEINVSSLQAGMHFCIIQDNKQNDIKIGKLIKK